MEQERFSRSSRSTLATPSLEWHPPCRLLTRSISTRSRPFHQRRSQTLTISFPDSNREVNLLQVPYMLGRRVWLDRRHLCTTVIVRQIGSPLSQVQVPNSGKPPCDWFG